MIIQLTKYSETAVTVVLIPQWLDKLFFVWKPKTVTLAKKETQYMFGGASVWYDVNTGVQAGPDMSEKIDALVRAHKFKNPNR